MLSDTSAADGFLKNLATKEESAQEQFLLLSPCFQLYSIIVLSFNGSSLMISGMFSKLFAEDSGMRERINTKPFVSVALRQLTGAENRSNNIRYPCPRSLGAYN